MRISCNVAYSSATADSSNNKRSMCGNAAVAVAVAVAIAAAIGDVLGRM